MVVEPYGLAAVAGAKVRSDFAGVAADQIDGLGSAQRLRKRRKALVELEQRPSSTGYGRKQVIARHDNDGKRQRQGRERRVAVQPPATRLRSTHQRSNADARAGHDD